LRDARKIKGRFEVTLSGGKLVGTALAVMASVGMAFFGGYFLGDRRGPVVIASSPSFPFNDPLAILDRPSSLPSQLPRVAPLLAPAPAPLPTAPSLPLPPARSGLDEVRALEERVRSIAGGANVQVVAAQTPPPAAAPLAPAAAVAPAAPAPSTDVELRRAMGDPAGDTAHKPVVELSKGAPKAGASALPSEPRSTSSPAPAASPIDLEDDDTDDEPKHPAKVKKTVKEKAKETAKEKVDGDSSTPVVKPLPRLARKAAKGRFTLQVRAYPDRDKDKAEELVEHLKQRGFEAYMASAEVGGRGMWYRVRVGKFPSRDDAERFRERLQSEEKTPAFVTVVR